MHRSVFVCVCVVFFCESLCGEERGRGVEEFIIVMGLREEWLSREVTHTTPGGGSLHTVRLGGWGGGGACDVSVCSCVCVGGGRGGEIGQSAGGVIVLPDSQLEHRSPLSSSGP